MREEAGELCQTLEAGEGKERAASEAADLIYHAMVLLNKQVGVELAGAAWAGGHVGAALTVHGGQISWLAAAACGGCACPTTQPLPLCCRAPQGVSMEDVSKVLRSRFGTSGVEEKAARPPKA